MSEITYIRGPYPSQKIISGNQSFYVEERISPALKVSRKVVFTKELGYLFRHNKVQINGYCKSYKHQ